MGRAKYDLAMALDIEMANATLDYTSAVHREQIAAIKCGGQPSRSALQEWDEACKEAERLRLTLQDLYANRLDSA